MKSWCSTALPFFIVLLFSNTRFFAQDPTVTFTQDDLFRLSNLSPNSTGVTGFDLRYEGVKGTPYLFTQWVEGEVFIKGKVTGGSKVKFNIDLQKHIVFFQFASGLVRGISAGVISHVIFHDSSGIRWTVKYLDSEIVEDKKSGNRFYLVLHEGKKSTLYKSLVKNFKKADFQGAYSKDQRYDEYESLDYYLVKQDSGLFERVKLKQKALEKALPAYAEKIRKWVDAQKSWTETEIGVKGLLEGLEE